MSSARSTLRTPTELALAALSAAALLSFRRLFVDWSFLGVPLIMVLAGHALAAFLRRRRIPLPSAAVLYLMAGVALGTWLLYRDTTFYGLPTGLTWDLFVTDARAAASTFQDVQAPTDVLPGFQAGAAIAFWIAPFLADWSAFRVWASLEATLPALGLFVFASLFGADVLQVVATLVMLAALAGFLLLFRTARLETSATWVRGDAHRGSQALLRAGAQLGAVALVGGLVLSPLVPGSRTGALVDWKELGGGNGTRITLSPLVDIQSRLVQQSDVEVFTVRSPERSYWRLTALDTFDGRLWKSSKRFSKPEGEVLPSGGATSAPRRDVPQEFTIEALSQIWLPAAFEPASVRTTGSVDATVRWEPSTATLIVDEATSDGLSYEVTSQVPAFDADALAAVSAGPPADVAAQYLELPDDFSPRVAAEAVRVTAGATTPYAQGLALQNYFRDNFSYSLAVTQGHGDDRLEGFLFDERTGYCEQFSGTYAAMARSLGVPARVAVGFTPGEVDPEDPTLFRVKGRHAHAWPEIYIDGFGWVPFEPTPGRGAPGAAYTGVAESQDTPVPVDPNADPGVSGPLFPEDLGALDGSGFTGNIDELGDGSASSPVADESRTSLRALIVLAALVGIVAAYLGGIGGWSWWTRQRMMRRAVSPNQRIDLAWHTTVAELAVLGVAPVRSETPVEFARRAQRRARLGELGIDELAELTTAARYSGADAGADQVERATSMAGAVQAKVRELTSRAERLAYRYSPKQVYRRNRGREGDGPTLRAR